MTGQKVLLKDPRDARPPFHVERPGRLLDEGEERRIEEEAEKGRELVDILHIPHQRPADQVVGPDEEGQDQDERRRPRLVPPYPFDEPEADGSEEEMKGEAA